MKYYLSSYELGNASEQLRTLVPKGKIGYVPNARDFSSSDPLRHVERTHRDVASLKALHIQVEVLDLRKYFDNTNALAEVIREFGAIFVSGGNVFILRQAMQLSGLDNILGDLRQGSGDFLYAGYSAAGCILAPKLNGCEFIDQLETPYPQIKNIIWDGLGHLKFLLLPHWRSEHPESADVEKAIIYCEQNSIPFRAIKDGEVIVIE